ARGGGCGGTGAVEERWVRAAGPGRRSGRPLRGGTGRRGAPRRVPDAAGARSRSGLRDDQPGCSRARGLETRLDIRTVNDAPDRLDVILLHVLLVLVERVLQHVQLEQRDRSHWHTVLLIVELLDHQ